MCDSTKQERKSRSISITSVISRFFFFFKTPGCQGNSWKKGSLFKKCYWKLILSPLGGGLSYSFTISSHLSFQNSSPRILAGFRIPVPFGTHLFILSQSPFPLKAPFPRIQLSPKLPSFLSSPRMLTVGPLPNPPHQSFHLTPPLCLTLPPLGAPSPQSTFPRTGSLEPFSQNLHPGTSLVTKPLRSPCRGPVFLPWSGNQFLPLPKNTHATTHAQGKAETPCN